MNSFIGISKSHTTNFAVVAPGIAEALLATAFGLAAAIPAVVIYNMFARSIAGYRATLGDAAAEVLRLVSRDLERAAVAPTSRATPLYVTSPPSESASDLADFHSRHGEAPRFAGQGREMAAGLRRMGRYGGRSDGRLRASSQGVEGWILPPGTGSPPPPQKSRPPGTPPFFNQR
jgi:hypothetical protein